MQIIGNYFEEARMLNLAHAYQRNRLAPAHAGVGGLMEGAAMKWEVVIGLETHAQLSTRSKMFSGASTAFGACAEHAGERRSISRCPGAAGRQSRRRRARDPLRARGRRQHQPPLDLRSQELLLSRSSQGLPDQPVRDARSSAGGSIVDP